MSDMENLSENETEVDHGKISKGSVDLDLLIETIQYYEFLYNVSHKDYKDNKKKSLAWEEIATVLNSDAETCQKLWKSLRDRFLKEKKKKSGAGGPESTWTYFEKILLYGRFTKPRKTYTTMSVKENSASESSGSRSSSAASPWSTIDTILSPASVAEDEEGRHERITVTPTASKGKAALKKRKIDADIEVVVEAANKICASLSAEPTTNNSNNKFVEYLFTRLEEMFPEEAKEKEKKCCKL